jgi:hypothetical protein
LSAPGIVFPGEVAAIVANAPAKGKQHRYRSTAELAADVRRYLDGEAVLTLPGGGDSDAASPRA